MKESLQLAIKEKPLEVLAGVFILITITFLFVIFSDLTSH
jgi:hypothetical protein